MGMGSKNFEALNQLSGFSKFRDLPQELQDKVWDFVITSVGGRVVEVRKGPYRPGAQEDAPWTCQYESTCPVPNVLHACQDARNLALKRWRLSFVNAYKPAIILFDFENDVLSFGQCLDLIDVFKDDVDKEDRMAVQHIAFDPKRQYSMQIEDGKDLAIRLHRDFPRLSDIVFVVNDDLEFSWETGRMYTSPKLEGSEANIVTFSPAESTEFHERHNGEMLKEFKKTFMDEKWRCPEWSHLRFQRSYPK